MNQHQLSSFSENLTVAVIGGSGGIGQALVTNLAAQPNVATVFAYSRSIAPISHAKVNTIPIDITSEDSVRNAVEKIDKTVNFDIFLVATGILHDEQISPEKSMKDLNMEQLMSVFTINTFGPAIITKYFLPRMRRDRRSVFACLSARVGSIDDNRLGGWYAYRASKCALNMIIKNAAIEISRRNQQVCVVGLHPGTVNTSLSKPFQGRVAEAKLFTPDYSSECLLKVINHLSVDQSGKVIAWDGSEIPS